MAKDQVTRRLAAIVAADIAGYSRLMGLDEAGTLARLKDHRAATDPIVEAHGGRIVKTTGDGLLLEFPSVVDAVACAVEVQRVMAERNAGLADDERMDFRIGVNLGDIIVDGDDIHGDGVNVAARLEALAEPGGIALSGAAHEQVRDKLDLAFDDQGEVEVKNITRPVRVWRVLAEGAAPALEVPARSGRRLAIAALVALLVAVAGAAGWWWQSRSALVPPPAPIPGAIAVLPFTYLGADKEANGYLAEGLSDNIIAAFVKVPQLTVIDRNSAASFKGADADVRRAARELGVGHVLKGSLQRQRDRLRVTAQLIDGTTGEHIWAGTYDRQVEDIFAIQDEITLAILRNVYGRTQAGDIAKRKGTRNLAAWAEYMKGSEQVGKIRPEENKAARTHFEKAVEIDPNYVDAFASLAFSHLMDARNGFASDPEASLRLAKRNIEKALALDKGTVGAHTARAILDIVEHRPDAALKAAERAVELAPNDAFAVFTLAWTLRYGGNPKASQPHFARARILQPRHPAYYLYDEIMAYVDAGDFKVALDKYLDAYLEGMPSVWKGPAYAVAAAIHQGTGTRPRLES